MVGVVVAPCGVTVMAVAPCSVVVAVGVITLRVVSRSWPLCHVLWSRQVSLCHVVSQLWLLHGHGGCRHTMWCCNHGCCAVWCHGCCHCTMCGVAVMAIAPCGVVVMEGVVVPRGITVSGWAMVGLGGRGWLCVHWQREWQGYMVIGPQKMKLAGKRKKESRTSRVSQHEEHSNIARVVMRAQQPGEVLCAAGEEHGKVSCAVGKEHGEVLCAAGEKHGEVSCAAGEEHGEVSHAVGKVSRAAGEEHGEVSCAAGEEHGEVLRAAGEEHGKVSCAAGKKHGEVSHAVGEEHSEVSRAAGEEHGEVACNCEAQGNVGAC